MNRGWRLPTEVAANLKSAIRTFILDSVCAIRCLQKKIKIKIAFFPILLLPKVPLPKYSLSKIGLLLDAS